MTITEPGVYFGLPAEDYHAQSDWLSWSQMKHLVPPSTPAHFKAAIGAPREEKRHFDFGKVVHALVLGDGDEFEVVQTLNRSKEPRDAEDYKSVSSQAHRDEIYAAGKVPILRHELEAAEKMAAQVAAHPVASALLSSGKPEVSLFWIDDETGVKCRARLDWLPEAAEGRRLIVPDVKTTIGLAAGDDFSKAAARYGYYGQQQHYSDGIRAAGIDDDPAFLFVTIEKTAPHLVSVNQYADPEDIRLARRTVSHCRRLFAQCTEADHWPGWGDGINDIHLPTWTRYELEDAIA